MRKWVILLLLLPTWTWAAAINVTRCWTPDGPYVPVADVATKCPPQLSAGSANTVAGTSYNISVTTTKNSGTIYTYTSTSATPPARKVHIAGTGAVHAGTITVTTTGAQTRAITGLTADTQYYTHTLHVRSDRPSNRVTISQRTTGMASAVAGYFWGTGGSDFSAGTSHGARFASLQPTQSLTGIAVGTDIWGLAGSTHSVGSKGKFRTKWAGSAGNPAMVATYYIDGVTPTAAWEGSSGAAELDTSLPGASTLNALGSVTMASIYGSLTDACLAAKDCNWQYPIASECADGNDSIVFTNHSYVHWRAMKIEKSACRGMTVIATGVSGERDGTLLGFRFRDGIVQYTGAQGIIMQSGVKYSLIHDTIGRRLGECRNSRAHGGKYPTGTSGPLAAGGVGCVSGGSAFIVHSSHNSYSGFNNVALFTSATENLHCLRSSHVLMRYNRGGNVIRGGLYRDTCGDSVVEQNIAWGHNNNLGFGAGTYTGTSKWGGTPDNNAEASQYTSTMSPTNNIMRSNLIIGTERCMSWNLSAAAAAGGENTSGEFYHNTCVANWERSVMAGNNITAALSLGIDFKNNLFADPTLTLANVCNNTDTTGDYNLWSKATTAACDGANDIAGAAATAALLTLPVGTSGSPNTTNIATWRNSDYLATTSTQISNARPTAADHVGTRLNNVQCIPDAEEPHWAHIFADIDDPVAPSFATWKMCASEYLDGQAIPNTNVVIGALKN